MFIERSDWVCPKCKKKYWAIVLASLAHEESLCDDCDPGEVLPEGHDIVLLEEGKVYIGKINKG